MPPQGRKRRNNYSNRFLLWTNKIKFLNVMKQGRITTVLPFLLLGSNITCHRFGQFGACNKFKVSISYLQSGGLFQKASMKIMPKALSLIISLFLMQGCATTILISFESTPPDSQIYVGFKPDQMDYIGTTPLTWSYTEFMPYWKEAYFQFRKEGYHDSEIIHEKETPINTNRKITATLTPKKTTISISIESTPPGAQIFAGETPIK